MFYEIGKDRELIRVLLCRGLIYDVNMNERLWVSLCYMVLVRIGFWFYDMVLYFYFVE